jgi:hypothetical protein
MEGLVDRTAAEAGKLLGRRLREGRDPAEFTARMRARMMAMFGETA